MNQRQSQEMISIKLDASTVSKIKKLGNMNENVSSFIKKLVEHAHICDIWWVERDGDEL
ncbi:MAG: hypothetical protein HOD60_06465 [Candidatus Nitrosopelagicus sp.]|jgi:hypothetical protein|nr:hypothetical protein [Candidatus Nitrosopelagicus sp.]